MSSVSQETRNRPALSRIESVLIQRGVISPEDLVSAKDRQRGAKMPLVEVLLEQDAIDEGALVAVLAEATRTPVCAAEDLRPDESVQQLVPPETAQRLGLLPLRLEGDCLVVATGDPLQLPAFDELARSTGYRIKPVFARPSDVRTAMRSVRQGEEALHEVLKHASQTAGDMVVAPHVIQLSGDGAAQGAKLDGELAVDVTDDDAPTVKLVNLLLSDGIRQGASDIHVEAEKSAMKVRLRLDGELREVLSVPRAIHPSVLSRLKIISGLDIMENRRPQDGRSKIVCAGKPYDIRVSTLPSYFGEKCVIRILDPSAATFDLDRCGIEPEALVKWRELIHRPNGLVLMTGPTGSGKTSTLFASLLEVRSPKLNIVTVEDPVEYQFPGIVHVPVRSGIGMTFAAALRSILRQDPDVVLVGEIRDAETAQIAIQAALTGHLVLSTLHTNDAIGAIPRLIDLGAEPALVASCLLGVMAQRLVRTVCDECAVPYDYGTDALREFGWTPDDPRSIDTRQGPGCGACRGTGQQGRTAIAELVVMTPGLSALVSSSAEEHELLRQARSDGTQLLVEAGLGRVLDGTCAPHEARRVAATDVQGLAPTREIPIGLLAEALSAAQDGALPAPAPAPPTAAAPASDCAGCGAAVQAAFRFCPSCGAPAAVPEDRPTVLIVDDDAAARKIAALALRADFGHMIEAATGRQALEHVAVDEPDLMIIDQVMPGLTGVEVIRSLRSRLETSTLPIIMITATQDEAMEGVSLDAGADDYLQKPVPPARLRARALALLRRRKSLSTQG